MGEGVVRVAGGSCSSGSCAGIYRAGGSFLVRGVVVGVVRPQRVVPVANVVENVVPVGSVNVVVETVVPVDTVVENVVPVGSANVVVENVVPVDNVNAVVETVVPVDTVVEKVVPVDNVNVVEKVVPVDNVVPPRSAVAVEVYVEVPARVMDDFVAWRRRVPA